MVVRRVNRRGQHTAEFALLIGLVTIAAVVMQDFARRALMSGMERVSDDVLGARGITASPSSIPAEGTVTLTWNIPLAASCEASGGWSGPRGPSGSEQVTLDKTTTYTLTCVRADTGEVMAPENITVTVGSALNVNATQEVTVEGEEGVDFERETKVHDTNVGHAEDQDVRVQTLPDTGP